jgi:CBS domain containing-hemolysin-like protein
MKKEEQFSRLPIYEETIGNIIGVLYIKDLIFFDDEDKIRVIKSSSAMLQY